MSFTNAQLAQKISDLIDYWSSFNEEYSDWLGGAVDGGPSSDGEYPLTDYTGNETLVKSPSKLQDDVDNITSGATAQANAAAASAAAALTSEGNAATSESNAETYKDAAAASAAAAAIDEADAQSSATVATAQANLATDRVGYAEEWAQTAFETPVSVAAGGDGSTDFSALHWATVAEGFAGSVDSGLYGQLADAEVVTAEWSFDSGLSVSNGGLLIEGTTRTMITPVGSYVQTMLDIPYQDLTAYAQQFALGIGASSHATSRVFSVFDARTGSHQPSIGVFSPDETDLFGFSWDGSSTVAYVKSVAANIGIRIDNVVSAVFTPTGTTFEGTLAASGAVTGSNLNVSNWDTAYGWGDWAATVALKAPLASPSFTGTVSNSGSVNAINDTNSRFLAGDGVSATYINYAGLYGTRSPMYVQNSHATGNLYIRTNSGMHFGDTSGVSSMHVNTVSKAVTMYGALAVTGAVTGSNLNVSNWDTAYGWGNHSGLYKSLTAQDTVVVADQVYDTYFTGGATNPTDRSPVRKMRTKTSASIVHEVVKGTLLEYSSGGSYSVTPPITLDTNTGDITSTGTVTADGGVFNAVVTFNGSGQHYIGDGVSAMGNFKYRTGASLGGWARGTVFTSAADVVHGGVGAFGANDSMTRLAMGTGTTWYNGDGGFKIESSLMTVNIPVTVDGALTTTGQLASASIDCAGTITGPMFAVDAGHGNGIRFWNSANYSHYMSSTTDGTYGGRIGGDTTSDYNQYFTMSSGTNRGYLFSTSGTALFGINPDGVRSAVDLDVAGDITATSLEGSTFQTVSTPPSGSQFLRSASNGYTYVGWLNTVSGAHTNDPSRIYCNNGGSDAFVRYMTPDKFIDFLQGETWDFESAADIDFKCMPQMDYGIGGGYAENSGSGNFGATIWSLDTTWKGGKAGPNSANTSVYGIRWLRGSHTNAIATTGEGLYAMVNGTITSAMGQQGFTVPSGGDVTKTSHGNYLYHQSTAYDNDQNGGITFSTSAPSGGTTGDIWFEYT